MEQDNFGRHFKNSLAKYFDGVLYMLNHQIKKLESTGKPRRPNPL